MTNEDDEWYACVCGSKYRSRGVALQCCTPNDATEKQLMADGGEIQGARTFDVDRDPDSTISRLDEAIRQLEAASYVEDDNTVRRDIAWIRKRADALLEDLKESDA